jgi:nicotinamide phosphoribosyltransferase
MNKLDKTFKINPLYESDGYKLGHKAMLAKGTTRLYGTWVPRNFKYMHPSITKLMSAGQQMVVRYLHSNFQEGFFDQPVEVAYSFVKDMAKYLGMDYDGQHFIDLHKLGYLPIAIKALPEGMFTKPNIPHMTFINTHDDYAWLTLFLETYISKLAWQMPVVATIGAKFKENAVNWVNKTDKDNLWLADYMCHDFHARGGNPFTSIAVCLGHSFSNYGSDTLTTVPASRYFYDEEEVCTSSVNASEHSVSTTKIFTVGEKQMIIDWLKEFPTGILSIVADTFDIWKLLLEYLTDPEVKALILARDGKLVIRGDSGDPVDIICGRLGNLNPNDGRYYENMSFTKGTAEDETGHWWDIIPEVESKGVVEILWDIFGGTTNEQGYKVLDSHIGAIYGDAINLERQIDIYERLEAKGFAATNIVLGIGSFSYVYMTRDQAGFAAKGAWFEVLQDGKTLEDPAAEDIRIGYDIYKDPVTDDGTKKSLKGRCAVYELLDVEGNLEGCYVRQQCTEEEEKRGLLQAIYVDGKFYNQTTLTEIRKTLNNGN